MTELETLPEFRLALGELREQFHKVEVTEWDAEKERLYVRIYRDEETIVGRLYYLHNHDGAVWRRDVDNGVGAGFPVSPPPIEKPAPKRVTRRRKPRREVAEVHYSDNPTGLTWLFIKRAEAQDQIRDADLKFARFPNAVNHGVLIVLREKLNRIEAEIVDEAGLPLFEGGSSSNESLQLESQPQG